MKKNIQTTYTEEEFRRIIRQEVNAALNNIPGLPIIEVDEGFITIEEACKHVSLKKSTIYGLIHRGKIPYHKTGKRLLFKRSELSKWLSGGKEGMSK